MEDTSIGKRLKEVRLRSDMTQQQVEREADVSNGTVSKLETSKVAEPGVAAVMKLARAVGCDPAWLAWGSDD